MFCPGVKPGAVHTICPLAIRGRGYLLQSSDFRSPDPQSGAPEGRSARSLSRPVRAGFPFRGLAGSPVLRRLVLGSAVLIAVIAAMAGIAAAVGPYAMPPLHAVGVILDLAGLADSAATATERAIVETIRLPRIVLALLVGGALGVSGAIMQGLFRNPMADPGIIGVSTGGAAGAVLAIAIGANAAFPLALPAMAFAGAAGALALVYAVASTGGRLSMAALLLTGVAVSAFLAAVISAIVLYTEDQGAQRAMIFWLAGGLDASRWADVRLAAPFVLAGAAVAVVLARDLNLLMVSEDEARALGVRVGFTRNLLLIAASLITGTAVAFSGTIAFVGLVVPHALRLVVGADHRVLIPLSALGGGLFLLAADTLARVVVAPAEVRVGIVTSFVGAPFFLFLLIRNKSRAGLI